MIKKAARRAAVLLIVTGSCGRAPVPPTGLQGIVELDERVIAFEVAGRVRGVMVHRGDMVRDGAVLAELDDTLARLTRQARLDDVATADAELALLEAGSRREDVASLGADVRAAHAEEELASKTVERAHALQETGSLAQAEVDRDEADQERAILRRRSLEQKLRALAGGARPEEIARARARVESASAEVALEDERLLRHVLRAKGEGMAVDVTVEPGELAAVGTPAVTLADVNRPYVDVFVPQGQLDGIRIGVKALVRVDSMAASLQGVVEYVSPKTEFTPRFLFSEQERPHLVVRVRTRIDDARQLLHAGVPAFVQFER